MKATTLLFLNRLRTWALVCLLPVAAGAEGIIVDNAGNGSGGGRFTTTGAWTVAGPSSGCFGRDYAYATGDASATARFQPTITTAGTYRIYVRWPAASAVSPARRVALEVACDGGSRLETSRRLNQQHNGGVWVYVGAYWLSAGEGNSVTLRSVAGGSVLADAVLCELSAAGSTPPMGTPSNTERAEYANSDSRLNPVETLIVRKDAGTRGAAPEYELRCDGQPFAVKGACGVEAIAEIAAAGANAVRSYAASSPWIDDDVLKRASDAGVKVMVGLNLARPTNGFYRDPAKIAAQFAALSAQIERWKNHASVLAWGIGNEIDPLTLSPEDRAPIYAAIEQLARYAREHDHYHPTISVHAGSHRVKVESIRNQAPSIDIVAVNTYAHTGNAGRNIAEGGWKGPYFVTEYSINQPMEQRPPEGATPWGAVVEPLSRAKMDRLRQIYREYLTGNGQCLGGFVFKAAGRAFRVTPTWYLLFHDEAGVLKPTPSLDAMRECWLGRHEPATAAPLVDEITLDGRAPSEGVIISGDSGVVTAEVRTTAPEGASLGYVVEIRPDVSIQVNTIPAPLKVPAVQDSENPRRFFVNKADLKPGDYRLYDYVRRLDPGSPGGYVSVATANIPFRKR